MLPRILYLISHFFALAKGFNDFCLFMYNLNIIRKLYCRKKKIYAMQNILNGKKTKMSLMQ